MICYFFPEWEKSMWQTDWLTYTIMSVIVCAIQVIDLLPMSIQVNSSLEEFFSSIGIRKWIPKKLIVHLLGDLQLYIFSTFPVCHLFIIDLLNLVSHFSSWIVVSFHYISSCSYKICFFCSMRRYTAWCGMWDCMHGDL